MKYLFKILFATVFLFVFSLINLGYAASPKAPRVYKVNVTVNNSGSAPLYYQNWQPVHPGVTVSGVPSTNTSITPNSSQTFPLTLKGMPGQLPQIMLTFGYDQTDSKNSCTVRIQPFFSGIPRQITQGKAACKSNSSVAGQSTNVSVNMMLPEKIIRPKIFNFTIKNDSSFPLKYYYTASTSLAGSLHTIPKNSSLNLTHTLATPDSVLSIRYGFANDSGIYGNQGSNQHFCTFSYQSSMSVATASPTGLVTCRVGSSNTMHVNTAPDYYPGAKCNWYGAWYNTGKIEQGTGCGGGDRSFCRIFKATCAWNKLTCKIYTHQSNNCNYGIKGFISFQDSSGKSFQNSYSSHCLGSSWWSWGMTQNLPYPFAIKKTCSHEALKNTYLNQHYGN